MSDDKDETLLGMRAISEGDELTDKQKLAVENHMRYMIGLRRFIQHMVNYWKRWLLFLIGGLVGGGLSFQDTIESIFK